MSYITILIASLIGSPHCAGMCGGFAVWSGASGLGWFGVVNYNLGRLVTYVALGIIAGLLGNSVDSFGKTIGVSRFAFLLVGILIVGWGGAMLLRSISLGRQTPLASLSLGSNSISFGKLSKFVAVPLQKVLLWRKDWENSPTLWFPLLLGITSTLLPCGWLYVYVMTASGAGSLGGSVGIMIIFWFGTLPVMLSVGSFSKILSPQLLKLMPVCTAILLILSGLISIWSHWNALQTTNLSQPSSHPSMTCHERS
jgi:uncharacterized protein